jgi:outer membrane protein
MTRVFLLFLSIFLFVCVPSSAQRFGYVDTQLIMEKMPDYATVQSQLDKMIGDWQKEMEGKQKELAKMRLDFEAEKVLFTEDMKKQRMADLAAKEQEIIDFQTRVFGVEGQLFQKRVELMKPIQDKLADAIAKVARKRKLSFIFDKAGDLTMVYSDPTHNYTDIVMEELGLKEKAPKK